MSTLNEDELKQIKKTILHTGTGIIPSYCDGTKITFHFRTTEIHCHSSKNENGSVDCKEDHILDDSRKIGKPMELILGKQFKMPVWESILKTMLVGEVSNFKVNKKLVEAYPLVSESYKAFAGIATNKEHRCCGMNIMNNPSASDSLMTKPKDLEFTMEVLSVKAPGEYEKESWAMGPTEKLNSVPILKDEGNKLFKDSNYKEAASKYEEALGRLEQLVLREKPGDEECLSLEQMKIPLLLNYSQCKLIEEDYYAVIQHTTTVLKLEPDNVKALFRRAKAHIGAWNPIEAKEDFDRALALDPGIKSLISKELKILHDLQQKKNEEDKLKLQGKMFA